MSTDWERHNTTFKEYKKECKAAHDKYLNDNVFNDEANPKKFYTYVKSKRKDNASVSTLKVNGCFIIDDCQKANALNDQYCSVFSTPDDITPPINTPEVKEAMLGIVVYPERVQALLSRIKPKKAPGDITSRYLSVNFQKKSLQYSNLYSSLPLTTGNYPKNTCTCVTSIQRWQ